MLAHDAFDKFGSGEVYDVAIMTFGAQPEAGDEKAQAVPHERKTIRVNTAGRNGGFFKPGWEKPGIKAAERCAPGVIPTLLVLRPPVVLSSALSQGKAPVIGSYVFFHHGQQALPRDSDPPVLPLR